MENGWQFQPLQTPAWLIGFAVVVWLTTAVISYRNWSRRGGKGVAALESCLLYTSPSPRDVEESRMPSSA